MQRTEQGVDIRLGVKVDLQSQIIQVNGFPFDIYMGQNVNETVDKFVKKR